jgi:hypothetical protein
MCELDVENVITCGNERRVLVPVDRRPAESRRGDVNLMIIMGARCRLCGRPAQPHEALFGTWGVWLPEHHQLGNYCDGGMHWECYAKWAERPHFARSCFDFWIDDEKTSVYWWKAYLDDKVLVTVNPEPSVESVWIHLSETGSRHSLRLKDWERWLREPCDAAAHPIEAIAMARAKRTLGAAVPTRERLLASVDRTTKKELLEKVLQEAIARHEAETKRREETPLHNRACDRLYLDATTNGLKCPHCGRFSRNYRLAARNGQRSQVIFRECGWALEPTAVG